MRIEDQYLDILQNLEFSIVTIFKERPGLSDYDVMNVLEALIDKYIAEQRNRPIRKHLSSDLEHLLFENVYKMCQWRLGRSSLGEESEKETNLSPDPVTIDVIILCLKRILKSVKKWNKNGGKQAYLEFVSKYVQ